MVGFYLFGFLPPGLVRGCPAAAGTLLTFIPINPPETLWEILANFNTKHFSLSPPLSCLALIHTLFMVNKVETLPVAGDGNGDPHTTRFPGALSKHKTQK